MPRTGSRDVNREKFWRRMIQGQSRSGWSIGAWCRKYGLHESAFYWWRRRLAGSDRERRPPFEKSPPFATRPTALGSMGEQGPALVPVRVLASEGGSAEGLIEIVLSGDRRIRVRGPVDRRMLADVLAVLAVDTTEPQGGSRAGGVAVLKLPSLGEIDQGISVRIYLCTAPTDMRKGFDSLAALVREALGQDPLTGHLFLFVGRSRDRLKILYWDKDGFAIWYNNVAENAIRRVAIGRKNWLFCGSDNGGRTAAILFSLIATCQRHRVDPFTYFRDTLTRIAATPMSQLDQFLPDQWQPAHGPKQRGAARRPTAADE